MNPTAPGTYGVFNPGNKPAAPPGIVKGPLSQPVRRFRFYTYKNKFEKILASTYNVLQFPYPQLYPKEHCGVKRYAKKVCGRHRCRYSADAAFDAWFLEETRENAESTLNPRHENATART